MNAYLRAAQKFPQICQQAAEKLAGRPDHAGGLDKPDSPTPAPAPPGKPIRRAKDARGRFLADDPSTPLDNEAWEELP
jgi:hypothetical protein